MRDSKSTSTPGALSAEAADVAARIGELASASLPLEAGIRAAAEEAGGRAAARLRRLADALARGEPLDRAVDSADLRLPAHVKALFLAAAASGRFPLVIAEMLRARREQVDLRRRVVLIVAYPALLFVTLMAVYLLFQTTVAPVLGQVFADLGLIPPLPTRTMMATAGYRAWIGVGVLAAVVTLPCALACIPGWVGSSRVLYSVPLIGPMWRWHRLGQWCRFLAMLVDERVPLPEAVRLSGAATPDADLAAACRRAAADLEQGQPLAACLAAQSQFPPTLGPLVQWGESASTLPEAFRSAAEMYTIRCDTHGSLLGTVLLPLMLLLSIAFLGYALAAIVAPIIYFIDMLT
jgi:type IV pilus assembly protein PilC